MLETLTLVGGRVEEEVLLRNEYLEAENDSLKSNIERPIHFNDSERIGLSKSGKKAEIEFST